MPRRRRNHRAHAAPGVTVDDLAESESAILGLRQQITDLTALVHAQQAHIDDLTAEVATCRAERETLVTLADDLQAVGETFTGACIRMRHRLGGVSSPHGPA